jgi:hypothetical protein
MAPKKLRKSSAQAKSAEPKEGSLLAHLKSSVSYSSTRVCCSQPNSPRYTTLRSNLAHYGCQEQARSPSQRQRNTQRLSASISSRSSRTYPSSNTALALNTPLSIQYCIQAHKFHSNRPPRSPHATLKSAAPLEKANSGSSSSRATFRPTTFARSKSSRKGNAPTNPKSA